MQAIAEGPLMTEQFSSDQLTGTPLTRLDAPGTGERSRALPAASAVPQPEVKPAPPAGRKRAILIIVLGIIAAGCWFGWSYWSHGRFIVATDDAYVRADTAIIASKVGGYLTSVPVAENQKVKAGDLLVQIDPVDYQLALSAAQRRLDTQDATIARIAAQGTAQRALIMQAGSQLNAAKADQIRAAAEYQRATALMAQKFGTPQRQEQARADRDRTAANVASAEAAVAGAEANDAVLRAQQIEAQRVRDELRVTGERAQRDLDFTAVRAPFDAVVGNRSAQPGALVAPGTRLLALVPLESAYVDAAYKETQIGRVLPGMKASISVDAYPDKKFEGVVESVAPASGAQFSLLPPENATGNFTKIVQRMSARIRLPKEAVSDGLIRPGLSVVVDVDTRTAPKNAAR